MRIFIKPEDREQIEVSEADAKKVESLIETRDGEQVTVRDILTGASVTLQIAECGLGCRCSVIRARSWKTTPASPKDLRAKGILNRHELFTDNGERLGLVIESGGPNEGSKPVAVLTKGEPKPISLDTVDDAKRWIEARV